MGLPPYGVSKVALNALTRMLAAMLGSSGVCVNSVYPGWVATEMEGPDAPRSVGEGTASIVCAVTLFDSRTDRRILPRRRVSPVVSGHFNG